MRSMPSMPLMTRSRSDKIRPVVKVLAVAIDDLTEQRHFFHALFRQRPHLVRDLADGPAALDAAPERDDAEGARVGAAIHDRDVGGHQLAALVRGQDQIAVLQRKALARFLFHQRKRFALPHEVDQRRGFRRGHEHIHPRELLLQRGVALDADHAAHDASRSCRAAFCLMGLSVVM